MKKTIEDTILSQHDVGSSINMLHKRMEELGIGEDIDTLNSLAEEYRLMCDAVANGMPNPQGSEIYETMLRRVFMTYNNIRLASIVRHRPTFAQCKKTAIHLDGKENHIRATLEQFVQDVAMASLLHDDERHGRLAKLYTEHQRYMDALFCALLVSRQWTGREVNLYADLLLSPTIDQNDAMIIVSAITLALLTVFDINKWNTLVRVYAKSDVRHVRQRALVGFALSIPDKEASLYDDVRPAMSQLLASTSVRHELIELQMQMVYCAKTEDDNAEIRHEIMPTFMDGIRQNGLNEDEGLADILGSNPEEKQTAEMEEKIERIREMQRKGSDVFFDGFAKMKGFPFFSQISNWFAPFSMEHPGIASAFDGAKGDVVAKFLSLGSFCDSDKYSFAFAFASVYDKMPKSVRDTFSPGHVPMSESQISDAQTDTYIRRIYLQNLYRFFYLFQGRRDFRNPFETLLGGNSCDKSFFVVNTIVRNKMADVLGDFAGFLFRQRQYPMLKTLVELRIADGAASADERGLLGYSYMRTGDYSQAIAIFRQLNEEGTKTMVCLKGLAYSLFQQKRYDEAGLLYGKLLEEDKSNLGYVVAHGVSLINSGNLKKGMAMLFKADYEHPGKKQVKQAMAWGYLVDAKPADSERVYMSLQQLMPLEGTDLLNLGYAKWFQSQNTEAIDLFAKYVRHSLGGDVGKLADDFSNDAAVIRNNGIELFETKILLNLVAQKIA